MVWGSLAQRLLVKELPDGVDMYITDVQLTIPEGKNEWWPTFSAKGGECIHKHTKPEQKKSIFPIKVGPTEDLGNIGHASLSSLSCFDSGEGPSIRVEFLLTGTINANTDKKPLPVGQKGSITISTPPWGRFWSFWSNPKQILVAYNLAGGSNEGDASGVGLASSVNVQVDVPYSMQTKDLHLTIKPAATPSSGGEIKGLYMEIATEANWILDAVNILLLGVYKGHEAGYKAVFGALGGWPAALGAVGLDEVRKVIYG